MPLRIATLRWITALAAATILITEILSLFHAIHKPAIAIAWLITLPALLLTPALHLRIAFTRPQLFPTAAAVAVTVMVALIGWTAALSPPNSSDTMSYHLPRVLHWMQNNSVEFFPTSYLNLIMLQPAAEYIMLHAYVLSGADTFSNFFQFIAYIGCILGVSSVAAAYGLNANAQATAAIFCATLPNAILQASGAKNDLILACFLVCAAVFALRWLETKDNTDLAFLGLAMGAAFCTKGTAYLFAPPLLAAILPVRQWLRAGIAIAVGIILLNAPQYTRNLDLSGSPLGFDSAHADGQFRWRVEHFGWKPTLSNALRHTTEQMGGRRPEWNQGVYDTVLSIHKRLGINPEDPDTTWRWAEYKPPVNANHEANANNKWHLLIFLLAIPLCRGRGLNYAFGVVTAFVLVCAYLKWQPYFSRLHLPLFVAMSPVAAMAIARIPLTIPHVVIGAILVSNARLAVTENWTRPLEGPRSLLRQSRNDAYFNDIGQWNNRESYLQAVAATASSGCSLVGIDTSQNHVQYPFQILLRQTMPSVRFTEVGVKNPSRKYAKAATAKPCVVLCPDCLSKPELTSPYESEYGPPIALGSFLLFSKTDPGNN
ncbi:MAG TPA: glycosyltransferase family 39 protein [Bryobacteraceae bacterium]|nr:glycosyltransferase family 39 protein [Bryobacteraceae bacterium]